MASSERIDLLSAFQQGAVTALHCDAGGRLHARAEPPGLLLPGAFNPIHDGHWGLAAVASEITGLPAHFELSVTNVDKPPLSLEEIRWRLGQFSQRSCVWLTRAATFVDKARLFPGVVFVIGADTAVRLVAPRYYQESEARMVDALGFLRKQGCRFLVAGRTDSAGCYLGLEQIAMPGSFHDLFMAIPKPDFHIRVSSSDIRALTRPVADRFAGD